MFAKKIIVSSLSFVFMSAAFSQELPVDNPAAAQEQTAVSSQPTEAPAANTSVSAEAPVPLTPLPAIDKEKEAKIAKLIEEAEINLYGDGVPVDLPKAASLYQEAASLGSPKAMMRLSALYRKGTGVEKSPEKAFELTKKAAELGYAPAQAALGISYLEGLSVEKDENLGNQWIEKAAESGHALSRVMAGERLLKLADDPAAQQKGKLFIDSILENASPQELYTISYSFGHGLRLPKDTEKAKYWAKASSDKGSKNGTYYLGELYWNANDGANAIRYFEKAAEMGLPAAQLQTGRLYRDGTDQIKKDPVKAAYWLAQAKDHCSPEDLLSVCRIYLTGPSAVKNKAEAQKFLELYISKASAEDLLEESKRFWEGLGVRKNFDLGGALALAALQKDGGKSACQYALKLAAPNWLRADPITAYSILNQCVLNKDATEEEKAAFASLESRMSAKDLQTAQDLTSEDALKQYLSTHFPTVK